MKPQHQHFSYFYPLPWTLNTPLQPPCIQMIPCPGSGAMLCCCPRWSGGNNISEVSLSIIQTGLIWLLSDILFYQPPTQTQPLKSANNPSSSFPLFSLELSQSACAKSGNKVTVTPSRSSALIGTKVSFFSSILCLRHRMRHTWHVTRALVQDTRQVLGLCWPGAGDGDMRQWEMRAAQMSTPIHEQNFNWKV